MELLDYYILNLISQHAFTGILDILEYWISPIQMKSLDVFSNQYEYKDLIFR